MRRIDQLLSSLGYCSRGEARDWVRSGRVSIEGEPAADPAQKADPAAVRVDGEPLDHPEGILIAYHKPIGEVCSRDRSEGPSVFDALPERWQRRNPPVAAVGRLDKDTSGLLLMTDQGVLAHRLASPKHHVKKTYRVEVDRDLSPGLVDLFASGTLVLEGEKEPCAGAELRIIGPKEAELVLTEGRFRQVRRMFASQGYMTVLLSRVRFGGLSLDGINAGTWKEVSPEDIGLVY
jgi:16S rRNA pseudouridine516 synthase